MRVRIDIDDRVLRLIDRKAGEDIRTRSQQVQFILKGWVDQQPVGWVTEAETVFWLRLDNPGDRKIAAIKEIRAFAQLDLKGAKDLVDRVQNTGQPATIVSFATEEEAHRAALAFGDIGATVHITETVA